LDVVTFDVVTFDVVTFDVVVLIALGLVVAGAAAVVMTVAVRATRRAIWSDPGPSWLPGVVPDDVVELSTTMARTAHLYRGFGHERAVHRAIRTLDRSSRRRPRVWSIATLDCDTLGRSTWFRLDDGTAVRIDQPIAVISGEPESETSIPEALISSAELVAAHQRPSEVVLQFRDAGSRIELRGSGAAIL
jgi:hypothetical protein